MFVPLLMILGVSVGTSPPPVLRLMTYNIHHAAGQDGRVDVARVAAVIQAEAPDVVCLQEVDQGLSRTNRRDIATELAELLGMQAVFGPNYHFDGGAYGNATLTALPIVAHENVALPAPEGGEPRGALRVRVDTARGPLDVWNTHWSLDPAVRARQGAAMLERLVPEMAVLVAGDFNEGRTGQGLAALQTQLSAGPACETATYPSDAPQVRIDHVLAGGGVVVERARVVDTALAREASDHLPVVAELRAATPAGPSAPTGP